MDDSFPLKSMDLNSKTKNSITISGGSSSDEGTPVMKKTKSRTIRRGLSRNQISTKAKTSAKPVTEAHVYTSRVVKCLQDCKAGKIHIQLDQDDTEDITQEEAAVSCNSTNNTSDDEFKVLDDCETYLNKSNSPSPPPTPKYITEKRQTLKMKKAIRKLDEVRSLLQESVDGDDDDVVLLEESPVPEKQTMVVLIRYKETVHRFLMKRFEPFCDTIMKLSQILHLPQNKLLLFLNDKTVYNVDTPDSVDLHIADIIDCHVYTANHSERVFNETETSDPDAVSLCVQCMSSRSKVTVSTNKYQPLRVLMARFAAMKKIELSYLRFQFDGDVLHPSTTPASLDMEDGDCIDAIVS